MHASMWINFLQLLLSFGNLFNLFVNSKMIELQERGFFFFNCLLGLIKAANSYLQNKKTTQMWESFAGNAGNVKRQRNNMSNPVEHKWHMPEREQLSVFSLHRLGPYYYNQTWFFPSNKHPLDALRVETFNQPFPGISTTIQNSYFIIQ